MNRNAIARLEVMLGGRPVRRGTASLVGRNVVVTALHLVADRKLHRRKYLPGEIQLTFPTHATTARVLTDKWDAQEDWVLLACDTPPADTLEPLVLGTVDDATARWETYGFPDTQPADGMVCRATIENCTGTLDGVFVQQLFCHQAAAGDGMPLQGLFGAAPCGRQLRVRRHPATSRRYISRNFQRGSSGAIGCLLGYTRDRRSWMLRDRA